MSITSLMFDSTRSDRPLNSNLSGAPAGLAATPPKQVADFLTVQSLTFPAATAIVTGVWATVRFLVEPGWADSTWVPFVVAVLIISASVATSWASLDSTGARVGAIIVGLINSTLLTGAALGVISVATNTPVTGSGS